MVRARAGDDIDHRTAVATVFCGELRLQVEFLDRVDGEKRCGSAADSCLVQRRVVEEGIVVVGAIERVVVGTVAVAIDVELPEPALRTCDAGRINGCTRRQCDQLSEVAAIQGEFSYELLLDHFAENVAGGFDHRVFGNHGEGFDTLLNLCQIKVGSAVDTHIDNDVLCGRGQVGCFCHDDVHAGGKFSKNVAAVFTGFGFSRKSGCIIFGGDFGTREEGSAGVFYAAADGASETLGEQ